MDIEVRPDGTIIAKDEATAIRLSQILRAQSQSPAAAPAPKRETASAGRSQRKPGTEAMVKKLAAALSETGNRGITSSDLAVRIGLHSSRGLAAFIIALRKEIVAKTAGDPNKAFWQAKDALGIQRWFASPALKEAGI